MWQAFLDQADAVMAALDQREVSFGFDGAIPNYTRRNQLTKRVSTSASGMTGLVVALESNDRDFDHAEFDRLVENGFELVLREKSEAV